MKLHAYMAIAELRDYAGINLHYQEPLFIPVIIIHLENSTYLKRKEKKH